MSRVHNPSFIDHPNIRLILRHNQTTDEIFLTIHVEPTDIKNEVPDQLNVIITYLNRYRKGASWLLAGGFNREPNDILNY